MKDMIAAFSHDLNGLSHDTWLKNVDDICEEFGYFEPVGLDYSALFVDAGRTLLVTFENANTVHKKNTDAAPLGWQFVKSKGWSSLTFLAQLGNDWFRHPAVFGCFDRMIDDGFFDDFDQILFYGAGAAGYAAAALSVSAPGARVLAIQPQASLDTRYTRWDCRFPQARRLDFCSRFGYAPAMVETARDVTIIHDPSITEDAMHAHLFNGANTTHLTCPYMGPNAAKSFAAMGVLRDQIEHAMEGTLTPQNYAPLWRERQEHLPYLSTMFHRLDAAQDHPRLLARLCRMAAKTSNKPVFAEKLKELEAQGV